MCRTIKGKRGNKMKENDIADLVAEGFKRLDDFGEHCSIYGLDNKRVLYDRGNKKVILRYEVKQVEYLWNLI